MFFFFFRGVESAIDRDFRLKIAIVKRYEVVFRIAYYMTGVFDNQETLVRGAKKDSWLVGN